MPKLRYTILTATGVTKEVSIDAIDDATARRQLRRQGSIVVHALGEAGANGKRRFGLSHSQRFDVYTFANRLSPLLSAGIPLEHGLAVLEEGCKDEERNIVLKLRRGLHEGKKFSDLIRSCGNTFPSFYPNLIETGEETGCLPEVTEELRRFMSESKETRDFIISSSIYPSVVLGITVIVVIVMFTIFVPRFAVIFSDMGREQPPPMVFLMTMSTVLSHACWLVPLCAAGAWFGAKAYMGAAQFREWRSALLTRIPVFGKILVEVEVGRFIRTLAILISNHVDIIKTRGGEKLSAALAGNAFLPPGLASKVRVGEESSSVGPMLTRSAVHLEENRFGHRIFRSSFDDGRPRQSGKNRVPRRIDEKTSGNPQRASSAEEIN